jgi:hypothetical protein
MTVDILCSAIRAQRLLRFYYAGDDVPGPRLVEPHMVAFTTADNLVLSGWFLGGLSESRDGQGWREYLLDSMSDIVVLPDGFLGPRPGYNPSGGTKLKRVQCRL